MGFAKLDIRARAEIRLSEVIFCAGKPDDYLVSDISEVVQMTAVPLRDSGESGASSAR